MAWIVAHCGIEVVHVKDKRSRGEGGHYQYCSRYDPKPQWTGILKKLVLP